MDWSILKKLFGMSDQGNPPMGAGGLGGLGGLVKLPGTDLMSDIGSGRVALDEPTAWDKLLMSSGEGSSMPQVQAPQMDATSLQGLMSMAAAPNRQTERAAAGNMYDHPYIRSLMQGG